jgi:hypothetical protein
LQFRFDFTLGSFGGLRADRFQQFTLADDIPRRHEGQTFGGRSVATFDFHGLLPENGPVALHRAFFSPGTSLRRR